MAHRGHELKARLHYGIYEIGQGRQFPNAVLDHVQMVCNDLLIKDDRTNTIDSRPCLRCPPLLPSSDPYPDRDESRLCFTQSREGPITPLPIHNQNDPGPPPSSSHPPSSPTPASNIPFMIPSKMIADRGMPAILK